ncbi:TetR/AcrR family transcriptional regulator [Limimaricola pyoseonensis]|uniref:Regulatory protein, tetR family n=1 Tax=Limimaricola pyoseonensis TaxID=521013 RepID=A0A1G7HQK5_9RHOB|nr:TetR/AcrR family transcriptional regulator [Limimaricola pyoseonensis]SDF02299.1 regulatory protein, tetR family [Limimaricola pyoseonensis]
MTDSATPRDRSARDRLLHAAAELFYDDGITATGIDAIIRHAGVARQSLYNNFASKSDLVARYVEMRLAEWRALHAARDAAAEGPAQKILAVFDAHADHAARLGQRGYRGCALLNAATELATDEPARAVVLRHKAEVEAIIAHQLQEMLPETPDRAASLAAHLAMLLEGALARAGLEADPARLRHARALAAGMLAAP